MIQEAIQVRKIRLSDARAELRMTQRKLAGLAKVAVMVVSNAENGYTIRRLSAHSILNALNSERAKAGKPVLTIEDIDWSVSGDGDD